MKVLSEKALFTDQEKLEMKIVEKIRIKRKVRRSRMVCLGLSYGS